MFFEKPFRLRFTLFNWKSWKYQQAYARIEIAGDDVVTDDGELEPSIVRPSRPSLKKQLLVYILILYMFLSSGFLLHLAFSTFFYPKDLPSISSSTESDSAIMLSPCGSTPAEARAAGCVFDIMAFSWLPPRCHDAELAEEFRQVKDWEYYLNRNRTMPLSQELAFTGEFSGLYTEYEYHLRHCTFLWRKMHRALLRGGGGKLAIDSVVAGYGHTEHCTEMLMTRRELALDIINSVILVKYPDCGMA